jgi:hypothetical protein
LILISVQAHPYGLTLRPRINGKAVCSSLPVPFSAFPDPEPRKSRKRALEEPEEVLFIKSKRHRHFAEEQQQPPQQQQQQQEEEEEEIEGEFNFSGNEVNTSSFIHND